MTNAFAGARDKTPKKTIHLEQLGADMTVHAMSKGDIDDVLDVFTAPAVLTKLKLGADPRAVMIGAALKAFDKIAIRVTRSDDTPEVLADVRAILPEDAADLIGEVVDISFPKGLQSFFDKLTSRLDQAGIAKAPAAPVVPEALAATTEADPSQAGQKMTPDAWLGTTAQLTPAPASDAS